MYPEITYEIVFKEFIKQYRNNTVGDVFISVLVTEDYKLSEFHFNNLRAFYNMDPITYDKVFSFHNGKVLYLPL